MESATGNTSILLAVVGSLNIDLVSYTSRIPDAGETLSSDAFTTGWGGKGANQAVAAARLASTLKDAPTVRSDAMGASFTPDIAVKMFGAVGADDFGPNLKKAMDAEHVDTADVRVVENQRTGVAVIIVRHLLCRRWFFGHTQPLRIQVEKTTGENRILVNSGANAAVLPTVLSNTLFRAELSAYPSLIVMQLETPLETVLYACAKAKRRSIPVLLNPAPAIPLPDSIYTNVTLLVVNETEAAILSGVSVGGKDDEDTIESAYMAAEWFAGRGCPNVIVTLGALGAIIHSSTFSSGARPRRTHVPAYKANVVDTTAAGDTFIGAVSVAIAGNCGKIGIYRRCEEDFNVLQKAVSFAVKAAAWTVARRGTWGAMPSAVDLI
jgi:ribokinase